MSDVRGLGVEVKSTYGFLYNKDDGFEREEKKQLYHRKRLRLVDIPLLDTISDALKGTRV